MLEFAYYPEQVRQGGLGDCYLISAVSCLAHRDNILNRCIDYLQQDLIKKDKGISSETLRKWGIHLGAIGE